MEKQDERQSKKIKSQITVRVTLNERETTINRGKNNIHIIAER